MTVVGHGRAALALVANCDPYTYVGALPVHVAPKARFDLGLDLVAPHSVAPWRLPQLAKWAFAGRGQVGSSQALYLHDQDEIEIECDAPLPLQVDGEDIGDVETARFEAERGALRVSSVIPGNRFNEALCRRGRADRPESGVLSRARSLRLRTLPASLSRNDPHPGDEASSRNVF